MAGDIKGYMRIEELLNHTGEWLRGTGPSAHIVMSSRVRLARNLEAWTFPGRSGKKELEAVLKAFGEAVNHISALNGSTLFQMTELDQVDRQMLLEGPPMVNLILTYLNLIKCALMHFELEIA